MPSESMTVSSMVAYEQLSPLSSKLIECCAVMMVNDLINQSAVITKFFRQSKELRAELQFFYFRSWIWDSI